MLIRPTALFFVKTLNNNDHNQVSEPARLSTPRKTIVLTKTACQQPWFWSVLSKVFPYFETNLLLRLARRSEVRKTDQH